MSESNGESKEPEVFDEFLPPKPVQVRGRDGNVRTYLVGESTGGKAFWEWTAKLSAVPEDAVKSGTDFSQLQADLICQCVTHEGGPVPREVVLGWGLSLRRRVFDLCQEQNGLAAGAVETEKKDSPAAAPAGGGITSPAASA